MKTPEPAKPACGTAAKQLVAPNRMVVQLSGAYTLSQPHPPLNDFLPGSGEPVQKIELTDGGITDWDSTLLALIMKIKGICEEQQIAFDFAGLPAGVVRLIGLAAAVPERADTRRIAKKETTLTRIGNQTLDVWAGITTFLSFLGEATASLGKFFTGRARYRTADLWLHIQECGPSALGIVTIISVLVGSILAFVGAIQLKMFGAEIYVANLVGLGMVIEMGALMTGIILAGRTGAAFAAQLGTMQVNEEIDALITMGIPPMEHLVLPRMIALAVMTPLLVLYADLLGILGGAIVGIFMLDIPPVLFFNQTVSMLSLWFCAQGLIKGSTFGIIVALSGCLRGIQCGRSASAVGDAATSAVVTSIVAIVLADAIWTFIFMLGGNL